MPGAAMKIGSTQLPAEVVTKISTRCVYVWGKVTYDDGFGNLRFTKFCHRYPVEGATGDTARGISIAADHGRYHEHGNDAD
jgi:hypothetical protein